MLQCFSIPNRYAYHSTFCNSKCKSKKTKKKQSKHKLHGSITIDTHMGTIYISCGDRGLHSLRDLSIPDGVGVTGVGAPSRYPVTPHVRAVVWVTGCAPNHRTVLLEVVDVYLGCIYIFEGFVLSVLITIVILFE